MDPHGRRHADVDRARRDLPIRDRDAAYGRDFAQKADRLGITTILTPVRAPQANAITERVIGTIRRECLEHVIVLSERHLRRIMREYVTYYNGARPHQAFRLDPPDGPRGAAAPDDRHRRVVGTPVLGGLHHVYRWAA